MVQKNALHHFIMLDIRVKFCHNYHMNFGVIEHVFCEVTAILKQKFEVSPSRCSWDTALREWDTCSSLSLSGFLSQMWRNPFDADSLACSVLSSYIIPSFQLLLSIMLTRNCPSFSGTVCGQQIRQLQRFRQPVCLRRVISHHQCLDSMGGIVLAAGAQVRQALNTKSPW